jgi:RNA polymerase sigma factor (sigma-70 family)
MSDAVATFAETFVSSHPMRFGDFVFERTGQGSIEDPKSTGGDALVCETPSHFGNLRVGPLPSSGNPAGKPTRERKKDVQCINSRLLSDLKPVSWEAEFMREEAMPLEETSQTEDDQLVSRARAGDASAFDQLVGRHTARLYGLVYHMTGNHEDTNDLLQDVWTKVFRSLAGFRGASRFSTWIHSIAVNMSINFLKRRNRRQTLSLDAASDEGGAPDAMESLLVSPHTPRSEAGISELQERLTEALGRLSAEHRAVVTMFDIQGMAHAEIGRVLGISEGTVRSRLFYAHRQLQAFLSDLHMEGAAV